MEHWTSSTIRWNTASTSRLLWMNLPDPRLLYYGVSGIISVTMFAPCKGRQVTYFTPERAALNRVSLLRSDQ